VEWPRYTGLYRPTGSADASNLSRQDLPDPDLPTRTAIPRRSQKKESEDRDSSMPGRCRSRDGSRSRANGSASMLKYESMSARWPAISEVPWRAESIGPGTERHLGGIVLRHDPPGPCVGIRISPRCRTVAIAVLVHENRRKIRMGIPAQFHLRADEEGGDLVMDTADTDRSVIGHGPLGLVAEHVVQVDRGVYAENAGSTGKVGVQGRASCETRMRLPVVLALKPGAETHVVVLDAPDRRRIEGDLELGPDRPEKAFYFSSSFWHAGAGMDQGDAQGIQDALGLVGYESSSIIAVKAARSAVRTQDVQDSALELQGVLGEREPGIQDAAGSVVQEGDEDGLAQLPRMVAHKERVHVVDLDAFERVFIAEALDLVFRHNSCPGCPVEAA